MSTQSQPRGIFASVRQIVNGVADTACTTLSAVDAVARSAEKAARGIEHYAEEFRINAEQDETEAKFNLELRKQDFAARIAAAKA